MRQLQLQLRRVLDRDDPLIGRNVAGQGIEQGRLAAAGASGNDHRDPAVDGCLQHVGDRHLERAQLEQALHRERHLGKFADRHQRPVDGDRADGDVDAGAIGQAGVNRWTRLVHPAADGGNDLVDDAKQMRLVLEMNRGFLELAEPLNEAFLVRVDQNVGDGRILEQRLDRAEANHLVHEVFDKCLQFALVERDFLGPNVFADIDAEFFDQLLARHPFQHSQIEFVDDFLVELYFFVQQRGALGDQLMIKPLILRWRGNADSRAKIRALARRSPYR